MNTVKWISLLLLITASTASAGDSWRDGIYVKRLVQDEPYTVPRLLIDFGLSTRVPVILAEGVNGSVINQIPPLKPAEYLTALCADNALFWYERNNAIFVYPNESLDSRVVPLGNIDARRLIELLRGFGLYSEGFPPRIDSQLGLMYITGPEAYLSEVQLVVDGLAASGGPGVLPSRGPEVIVEVIPLQYAWAEDRTYTLGNREYAVPGIATVLNNVLSGSVSPDGLSGRVSTLLPNNRPGLRGSGLIGPYNQLIASSQQAAIDSQVAAARAEERLQAASDAQAQINSAISALEGVDADELALRQAEIVTSPVIQADGRLNAIIIKDLASRMDGYREIIADLDRPVSLVEIKASIIDIDASYGFEFGLPGNVTFNNGGTQRSILANLGTTDLTNLAAAGNLTFQLADGAVNQLLVNLKALETDGHARLHAKPSVVTLDNQDAFLEEAEEFFVRVPGNDQVDLFNVSVGTKLTITPHVIPSQSGRQIRLSVNIEDGSRSATQQVDQIPVVSRNTINTQAVLLEGQSLLIGGLTRERETKNIRAVPVLGRIPKVGAFFRETVTEKARLERLVLLTPTVIDLPNCCASNGPHPAANQYLLDTLSDPLAPVATEQAPQGDPAQPIMLTPTAPVETPGTTPSRPYDTPAELTPQAPATGNDRDPASEFPPPIAPGSNPQETSRQTGGSSPFRLSSLQQTLPGEPKAATDSATSRPSDQQSGQGRMSTMLASWKTRLGQSVRTGDRCEPFTPQVTTEATTRNDLADRWKSGLTRAKAGSKAGLKKFQQATKNAFHRISFSRKK